MTSLHFSSFLFSKLRARTVYPSLCSCMYYQWNQLATSASKSFLQMVHLHHTASQVLGWLLRFFSFSILLFSRTMLLKMINNTMEEQKNPLGIKEKNLIFIHSSLSFFLGSWGLNSGLRHTVRTVTNLQGSILNIPHSTLSYTLFLTVNYIIC